LPLVTKAFRNTAMAHAMQIPWCFEDICTLGHRVSLPGQSLYRKCQTDFLHVDCPQRVRQLRLRIEVSAGRKSENV
jgi:hypothetical protein